MSVYDKRIADLKSKGATTQQAKDNQAHAVKVGADADGDGAVTNSEWAKYIGLDKGNSSSGSGSYSSGARTRTRTSRTKSSRSGGTKGSGSSTSGSTYVPPRTADGSTWGLAKGKVQAYKHNQQRDAAQEGTLGQFKFQAPKSKKWTV